MEGLAARTEEGGDGTLREPPVTCLGGTYALASYRERVLDDLADPTSVASRARLYSDVSALAAVLGAGSGSLVRGRAGFRDAPVRLVRAEYLVVRTHYTKYSIFLQSLSIDFNLIKTLVSLVL